MFNKKILLTMFLVSFLSFFKIIPSCWNTLGEQSKFFELNQFGLALGSAIALNADGTTLAAVQQSTQSDYAGILGIWRLENGAWDVSNTFLIQATGASVGDQVSIVASSDLSTMAVLLLENNSIWIFKQVNGSILWTGQAIVLDADINPTSSPVTMSMDAKGKFLVIGEPGFGNVQEGKVRIFTYNQTDDVYTETQTIPGESLSGVDGFNLGSSVALDLSGTYLAIGEDAWTYHETEYIPNGRTLIYKYNSTINTWEYFTKHENRDDNFQIYSNSTINYYNNTLTLAENVLYNGLTNFVTLYNIDITTGFVSQITLFQTTNNQSITYPNSSLPLIFNEQGTELVCGINQLYPDSANSYGKVKVFQRINATWNGFPALSLGTGIQYYNDNFGNAIALNFKGNILAIGAPGIRQGKGFMVVYKQCAQQSLEIKHMQSAATNTSAPTAQGLLNNLSAHTHALQALQNPYNYSFATMR